MSDTLSSTQQGSPRAPSASSADLLWDRQECVPLEKCLSPDDIILLLTPLVPPPESQRDLTRDPFEPLGLSLASRHPAVRHVPYTKNGISGVHVAFVKKSDVVIFIVSGYSPDDEVSQLELAELVAEACDSRPLIVVVCCKIDQEELQRFDLPTIIQTTGFSAPDLRLVSSVLLNEQVSQTPDMPATRIPKPVQATHSWSVQHCNFEQDLPDMHKLWLDNVPVQFHLSQTQFAALLNRSGYAMHYVVREPSGNRVVGYCANYTTYMSGTGNQIIGSMAIMAVHTDFRGHGIGRLLHDEALNSLRRVRGVTRIQLGSTFPRLLYGIPKNHPQIKWLEGKGWTLEQNSPGAGRLMADWILRFDRAPELNLASAGLNFRACQFSDTHMVAEMVSRESDRKYGFGWYDQYSRILDHTLLEDVILGFEGSTLVASAITYTPRDGNPTAADIPWPSSMGSDVGGITCICIKDDDPEVVNRRDTIMVRLLYSCCKSLHQRGMAGAFVDGLKATEQGPETLGFERWAEYHEVWQSV